MKILLALIKKECLQIIRDPSTIIIAFILPLIAVLIFMYGINLDSTKVTIGIKNDDSDPAIAQLVRSFGHSKYVRSIVFDSDVQMQDAILRSRIKGAVVIPNDFTKDLLNNRGAQILIITDGSDVNSATFVQAYSSAIIQQWIATSKFAKYATAQIVSTDFRVWYNPDLNSHFFILPGSIAIIMTLIGILLTALVIAREWERGTMESLLSTNVKKHQILLGKYIPYYFLGLASVVFNFLIVVFIFGVPFRGNFFVFLFVATLFLFTCFGMGLLISTLTKSQFLASQISLFLGFIPALLLSGIAFPINSMPYIFQLMTYILPSKFFATFIESEFLAGTIWQLVGVNLMYLVVLGVGLFLILYRKTDLRLEK